MKRNYRVGMERVGLDKVLSSFGGSKSGGSGGGSRASWFSSVGSKAKSLLKRNSATSGSLWVTSIFLLVSDPC